MLSLVSNLGKLQLRGWINTEDGRCESWHHFEWRNSFVPAAESGLICDMAIPVTRSIQ
jgi:hypothetical protein